MGGLSGARRAGGPGKGEGVQGGRKWLSAGAVGQGGVCGERNGCV